MMHGHYRLPLEAMIEVMKEIPERILLLAPLFLRNITKEACNAQLIIEQGRIHTCTVITLTGHIVLEQQEAYIVLQQLGDLEWSLQPVADSSPALERPFPQQMSTPIARDSLSLPRQAVTSLTPFQMRTLTSGHKHVFTLADGTKNIEHIARLLTKSSQEIQQILQDLHEMNLIK